MVSVVMESCPLLTAAIHSIAAGESLAAHVVNLPAIDVSTLPSNSFFISWKFLEGTAAFQNFLAF